MRNAICGSNYAISRDFAAVALNKKPFRRLQPQLASRVMRFSALSRVGSSFAQSGMGM
jgi:hypothetical protein